MISVAFICGFAATIFDRMAWPKNMYAESGRLGAFGSLTFFTLPPLVAVFFAAFVGVFLPAMLRKVSLRVRVCVANGMRFTRFH